MDANAEVDSFNFFVPSWISLKVPKMDSFFLLKPDLCGFDAFFRSIRVLPGDPKELLSNNLT